MSTTVNRGTTAVFSVAFFDEDGVAMSSLDEASISIHQAGGTQTFALTLSDGAWRYRLDTGGYLAGLLHWDVYARSGAADAADRVEITEFGALNIVASPPNA